MVLGGSIGSVYFGVLELTLVSDFYRFIRVLLKKKDMMDFRVMWNPTPIEQVKQTLKTGIAKVLLSNKNPDITVSRLQ